MSYFKLQAHNAEVVTPSDTAKIPFRTEDTRGCVLYIGVTGDDKVTTTGGEDVTFVAVPAGMVLPIQVVRVFATDTTATSILSLH